MGLGLNCSMFDDGVEAINNYADPDEAKTPGMSEGEFFSEIDTTGKLKRRSYILQYSETRECQAPRGISKSEKRQNRDWPGEYQQNIHFTSKLPEL